MLRGLKPARNYKNKGLIGTTEQAAEKGTNLVISAISTNEDSITCKRFFARSGPQKDFFSGL